MIRKLWFTTIALGIVAAAFHNTTRLQLSFTIHDVQVGDPNVSYANVEFTADGRYMVWFEQTPDGTGRGTVWHCAIDPETAEFMPPDCKGFRAFDSTAWGRANPGMDADGPYYVGMDLQGRVIVVRPTGPTTGTVAMLPTSIDLTRRAFYPTDLPHQKRGYVFWIKNERVPGSGTDPRNRWVELQYIDLADPVNVRVIERQERPPRGFAPMDVGFVRWFRGKPSVTYGALDNNGYVQVREFDLAQPNPVPRDVTNDAHNKIDPFPWTFDNQDILLPGLDAKAMTGVYVRSPGASMFTLVETIAPSSSALANPSLAQSNEPIVWEGKAYTAYQVNEASTSFFQTAFAQTGEIWLSTVLQFPQQQWRLSEQFDTAKAEPEPYVGRSRVWVFYSMLPKGANPLTATWRLRRTDTPLVLR